MDDSGTVTFRDTNRDEQNSDNETFEETNEGERKEGDDSLHDTENENFDRERNLVYAITDGISEAMANMCNEINKLRQVVEN